MVSVNPSLDQLNLEQHRQLFPALASKTYLNYGGQGPLPQPALTAILDAYTFEQTQGPFSNRVNAWINEQLAQIRSSLAQMLTTTPDRITLTECTTTGMNIPLWGLNWQPGDQIVLSDAEHPGVIAICQALKQRFGVEVVTVPLMSATDPVAVLESTLTSRTRMVVLSHILWNSGRIMPLSELARCCHQHGCLLHIDAAQSAGVLPLDLPSTGVDAYAFTGHKWLCGPAGVGALYISESAQEQIQPTFIGGRAKYGKKPLTPQDTAAEFEVSTSAWSLLAGWQIAMTCHDQWAPVAARYTRQVELARYLWTHLKQMTHVIDLVAAPPESGLVVFNLKDQRPAQVEATLAEQQILIRSLPNPVCLRASVHYLTTEAELDHLLQSLEDMK